MSRNLAIVSVGVQCQSGEEQRQRDLEADVGERHREQGIDAEPQQRQARQRKRHQQREAAVATHIDRDVQQETFDLHRRFAAGVVGWRIRQRRQNGQEIAHHQRDARPAIRQRLVTHMQQGRRQDDRVAAEHEHVERPVDPSPRHAAQPIADHQTRVAQREHAQAQRKPRHPAAGTRKRRNCGRRREYVCHGKGKVPLALDRARVRGRGYAGTCCRRVRSTASRRSESVATPSSCAMHWAMRWAIARIVALSRIVRRSATARLWV